MEIREAILHRILKRSGERGANSTTTQTRNTLLPADSHLVRITEAVLQIYARLSNSYGSFDANTVVHRFPVLLDDYISSWSDFIQFSKDACAIIASKMAEAVFSTGGYALFIRYENQGRDWLLVAMLKLRPGTGVDENTLVLSETLSFDVDHLHEAARIDIEKWQSNAEPYLSFVKKRVNGEDISAYFREALACTAYTDSKRQTEALISAIDSYCVTRSWSDEQLHAARRRTYDYCSERDRSGEEVNLLVLSGLINDQPVDDFANHVRSGDFQVNETFKGHPSTFRRLHRINGKAVSGNVKVSFDVEDLQAGRVQYDPNRRALMIPNLHADLVEQIQRNQPRDDD